LKQEPLDRAAQDPQGKDRREARYERFADSASDVAGRLEQRVARVLPTNAPPAHRSLDTQDPVSFHSSRTMPGIKHVRDLGSPAGVSYLKQSVRLLDGRETAGESDEGVSG
jgi:hypothetical protein